MRIEPCSPQASPDVQFRVNTYDAYEDEVSQSEAAIPLVVLHGWGCDSRIWQPVLPLLRRQRSVITIDLPGFGDNTDIIPEDLPTLLTMLGNVCPPQFALFGWSMGGMVALALASDIPERVVALATFGSNLKFAADNTWPAAMPKDNFDTFYAAFKADPKMGLKRFVGLQVNGGSLPRDTLRYLRSCSNEAFAASAGGESWQVGLDWLAEWDLRKQFATLSVPGLHIYATGDALVPADVINYLPDNPLQSTTLIENASHCFFYTEPERLVDILEPFLSKHVKGLSIASMDMGSEPQRQKQKVADSFGRAAPHYDNVAYFQRYVGERLLALYPLTEVPVTGDTGLYSVLDLGCGTGHLTAQLKTEIPLKQAERPVQVIGCDLAEGMVKYAQKAHTDVVHWIAGDAESLPFKTASIDLIFSSMALQWCENPALLFAELRRVLKPGGQVVFSTVGPDTLNELRQAWLQVDGYVHVNQFLPAEQWRRMAGDAGLRIDGFEKELRSLHYESVFKLMRELKTLGAHNVNQGQPKGLTGRQRIRALEQAYEQFRQQGQLPATYEIYYIKLTCN